LQLSNHTLVFMIIIVLHYYILHYPSNNHPNSCNEKEKNRKRTDSCKLLNNPPPPTAVVPRPAQGIPGGCQAVTRAPWGFAALCNHPAPGSLDGSWTVGL